MRDGLHFLFGREIEVIYNNYMKADFPEAELKPLTRIQNMTKEGYYEPYGLYEDGALQGYAFFVNGGEFCLLDYYAVLQEKRGSGYGSRFLKMIGRHYKEKSGLFFEVERPDEAVSLEERAVRERRIEFYQKNGLRNTEIRSRIFGVGYQVMYLPCQKDGTDEELKAELNELYHRMFPPEIYRKQVRFEDNIPLVTEEKEA
ncbi:GNAT family N-acetyltransferase [Hominifimenecus sp. rT4P-3]|uniref:GNAT family N-acetyltransferase n=1 Tax=Hominifimenecus sp. rT4P-3 TaxID=3242979 RepID=UPI003DA48DB8